MFTNQATWEIAFRGVGGGDLLREEVGRQRHCVGKRRRIAVRRSRNVGEIVESWTLRGRDARIDNTQRLEMFQAHPKWEIPDEGS